MAGEGGKVRKAIWRLLVMAILWSYKNGNRSAKRVLVKQLDAEIGQVMEIGTIHAVDFLFRGVLGASVVPAILGAMVGGLLLLIMLGGSCLVAKMLLLPVQLFGVYGLEVLQCWLSMVAVVWLLWPCSLEIAEECLIFPLQVATGVAEGAIRNTYKYLYTHASRLIPSSFIEEEDLRDLSM
ncbi:transcription initiation factor IIB-like [Magnolia sinica]|uniref:transcription initiation factor IIB-like n=1 Tax=Magnolia sinica TaxID=86752 RepID=UPI002658F149|nr:transcription initiation factor IIB-like [Magnolia sinica]